jgi:two-component system, LytTR family, response regulator
MDKLSCIIVEDDEIDRLTIVSFAKRVDNLEIKGVFESSSSALKFLEKETVDVLFLDIQMKEVSGLEVRSKAIEIPVCIFITGHPEHALESFDINTLDFIIKPLKFDRFAQTMQRIDEYMEVRHKAQLYEANIGGGAIYIKEGHKKIKLKLHEILYLEALKDYTLIVTEQKRHCVLSSLGNILKTMHFHSFIRVHRSFAVQKNRIQKIGVNEVHLSDKVNIPIGRSYRDHLNAYLMPES